MRAIWDPGVSRIQGKGCPSVSTLDLEAVQTRGAPEKSTDPHGQEVCRLLEGSGSVCLGLCVTVHTKVKEQLCKVLSFPGSGNLNLGL